MLASTLVEQVEAAGAREVLVLAPADAWAIEHVYGARLGVTWPRTVAVREVTSVLADALDQGRLQLTSGDEEAPYAYHDPCHAPRIGRDGQAPRRLLAAALGDAGGRELFWRRERAHPCGAIGGLEFVHPEVAAALAAARHADASAAGAVRLITENPACTHQLAHHGGLPVVNLYELLAARL